MKKISIILICASMLNFSACEKNPDTSGDPESKLKSTSEITAADNEFGLELFRILSGNETYDKNVFISPYSVAMALAMIYNGAEGDTKLAMEETLKKEGFTIDQINNLYKDLSEALLSVDPKVLMEIANSIWYTTDFPVESDFIDVNKEYYNAEVSTLDFSLPTAKDIINGWVADKTHDKILSIVDDISSTAVMYLINAIYFKGTWKYEFEADSTKDGDFTFENGDKVSVPMMVQQQKFNYSYNDIFTAVQLPYGMGDYSMIVMVPNQGKVVENIIEHMDTEAWKTLLNNFISKEVVVHLPRFTFEYKKQLNEDLINMGMGIAFSDNADFSGINQDYPLKISKVLHKSFVEVNEEGTEAAAVTSVEVVVTSFPGGSSVIHFYADKPFVFAICEENSGAIIFIGKLMDPS